MKFGEKLKQYRETNGYTQMEFSKLVGIGSKTLYLYETGQRYPRKVDVYKRIAKVMDCDYNYLLDSSEEFLEEVSKQYGQTELRKVRALTDGITSLFAGGEISDKDRDAAYEAITEAYWEAKIENKKYGRRKSKNTGEG